METTFPEWLSKELEQRNMRQVDLARKSGVGTAQISRILSGQRGAESTTLRAIARALKIPPEQVFVAAGLFPADADEDPWVEEMSHKLSLLSPRVREIAGKIIDAMADAEPVPNNKPKTKTKSLTP